jgi:hypothetical protein
MPAIKIEVNVLKSILELGTIIYVGVKNGNCNCVCIYWRD